MDREMSIEQELLVELLDRSPPPFMFPGGVMLPLSRKIVSQVTGYSLQAVSDYVSGKYRIPITFWRSLFAATGDLRIPRLILGNVDHELVLVDSAPKTGKDFFKNAVQSLKTYHEMQTQIADLLADGRIDEIDRAAVHRYDNCYHDHRRVDSELHHGIMSTYHRAVQQEVRS